MQMLEINGGKELFGEVTVSGSKNAALPIILATLVTYGKTVLENVPDISDVDDCLKIVEAFGARVSRRGGEVTIDTEELSYCIPPIDSVCRIRASTYLIGACLSRFDRAEIMPFGGCSFSKRPIDLHVYLAELFGARRVGNSLICSGLFAAHAVLDKISVGATVNALLLAVSASGVSKITPYAKEPHVFALIDYLRSAGAEIEIGEHTLTVVGHRLSGGNAVIIGDMIEAGTYLAAGIVTGGEVSVLGVPPKQLLSFLEPFSNAGVDVSFVGEKITVLGYPKKRIDLITAPYPGFPTDLQPIAAPVLALGMGGSIRDVVWQSRYGYLDALSAFGLEYTYSSGAAEIKKSAPHRAVATAPDLRGGAACVLMAIAASGKSVIHGMEIIRRGYAELPEKLRTLGADIK